MPNTGLAIDGIYANCLSCAGSPPPSPAVYANHSTQPNARLEYWQPSEPGEVCAARLRTRFPLALLPSP